MANQTKKAWSNLYKRDIIVCIAILISPFLLYSYLLFSKELRIINIFGLKFEHSFSANYIFIYYILIKIIPILLLMLWFLNTPYWWRYFIFSPIILYFFNLLKTIDPDRLIIFRMQLLGVILTFFLIGFMLLSEHFLLKVVNQNKINPSFFQMLKSRIKRTYNSLYPELTIIRSQQGLKKQRNYLTRLFGLRLFLDHRLSEIAFVKKPFNIKRSIEYLFVIILLLIPALYYSFLLVPEGETKFSWFDININSYGFPDTTTFIWFICQKICILIPLCIWFIVSRTWWKYAILSPIILYVFQIWEAVQDSDIVEEIEYLKALPFILVIVFILMILSSFVKYYSKTMDIYEDISDEIEGLIDECNPGKALILQKKTEFEKIKADLALEKGEERLQSLLKLRDELLIKLNSTNLS